MSGTPSGLSFLQSLTGYAQHVAVQNNPSANTPIRLAVIDPSYVFTSYPVTLPKVTFEGEETLTDKRYPVAGGYIPTASDRVVMLPVGHTFVILGAINSPNLSFGNPADVGKKILTGTVAVTIGSGLDRATASISFQVGGNNVFTSAPRVWLSWDATTGDSAYPFFVASIDSRTHTGATVRVAFSTAGTLGAARTMDVDWLAIGN